MSAGFRINTNVPALFAQRQLGVSNSMIQKNLERLSSGFRINKAADDAAGLAISERFRTQVNGLTQASKNIQDGISLIQTAEGGVETISDQLQRLRTLAVQAANDTLTTADRALLQVEVNEIIEEIDRQVSTVNFNNKVLLNGTFRVGTGTLFLQAGANAGQTIRVNIFSVSTAGLGLRGTSLGGVAVKNLYASGESAPGIAAQTNGMVTRRGAESAITLLSSAIDRVNQLRSELGAAQNRLERTLNFSNIQKENQAAAESRIRDLDFAEEIVNFTRNQILQQSGTAALAQANVAPQTVLQLLQ